MAKLNNFSSRLNSRFSRCLVTCSRITWRWIAKALFAYSRRVHLTQSESSWTSQVRKSQIRKSQVRSFQHRKSQIQNHQAESLKIKTLKFESFKFENLSTSENLQLKLWNLRTSRLKRVAPRRLAKRTSVRTSGSTFPLREFEVCWIVCLEHLWHLKNKLSWRVSWRQYLWAFSKRRSTPLGVDRGEGLLLNVRRQVVGVRISSRRFRRTLAAEREFQVACHLAAHRLLLRWVD